MTKENTGYLIRTIAIGVLQFLMWLAIFELSTWLILKYHTPRRMGPANGYGYHQFLLLIWIVFGIVMTGANLLGVYLKGRRIIPLLYLCLGILYISSLIHMLDHSPYRALQIMSTGILAMLCGLPLLIILKKKNESPTIALKHKPNEPNRS